MSLKVKILALLGAVILIFSACSSSTTAAQKSATATGATQIVTSSSGSSGAPAGSNAATLENSVVGAIQSVEPAVVEITVVSQSGEDLGSGSIITSSGYILTNDHVVMNGGTITVTTTTGNYPATIVGQDAADDLAVLKINTGTTLPVIKFADSAKAMVGEFVVAVGNPLGVGESATFGIISALNRTVSESSGPANVIPNAIQTSAPINPGNSGGALIDLSGNLVGIPTLGMIDQQYGTTASGIGFAIPSDRAQFIANQIIQYGKVVNTGRSYLGVDVVSVTAAIAQYNNLPISSGAYIQQLIAGGPAASAGLQVGDIIYKINNTTITDATSLGTYLVSKNPGDKVTVYVNRGGKDISVTVTLGTLPATA